MNKMHIIRTITAILLFALPATLTMADEPAQKPNIVFFLIYSVGGVSYVRSCL